MTTQALFDIGRATALRAQKVGYDGDRLTISGHVLPSTDQQQAVIASRQQLRGMIDNPDEEVFPVTCSADPTIDGYYYARSASVDDTGVFGGTRGRFAVTLERVGTGYRNVVNEGAGVAFTRTNSHSISGQSGQWSIPNASTTAIPPNGYSKDIAVTTRVAEDGTLRTFFVGTAAAATTARHIVPPASHYVGSARIESKLGGSTYYPMVGRQVPLTPSNWRLTNGLLRLQASATPNRLFHMYGYDAGWGATGHAVTLTARSATFIDTTTIQVSDPVVDAVTVLRNTPEVCTVRLSCRFATITAGAAMANRNAVINQATYTIVNVDISLRRGDYIATVAVSGAPFVHTTIADSSGATSSDITGGEAASATLEGNKFVVVSPATATISSTTSALTVADVSGRSVFGVGMEVDPGATTVAQEIAYQWFTTFTETQRVVLL